MQSLQFHQAYMPNGTQELAKLFEAQHPYNAADPHAPMH